MTKAGRCNRRTFAATAFALAAVCGAAIGLTAQARRDFNVTARNYAFEVGGSSAPEIRVSQNDLVHITFTAEDIPHSFTIEDHGDSHYRIMRRAEPGKPVSFDFRADTAGRFRFYCSLSIDDRCKSMQGTLVVQPRE
ncbi:MAG: cupredoxin domain-containing protein [Acidobacteria bacterium]|nr:cupredoxin domain-containing protein [Acidobacteriota bacterium]